MFKGSEGLLGLELNNFVTSNVKNMQGMFLNCISLISVDLTSFDTSQVTDMSRMFESDNSML